MPPGRVPAPGAVDFKLKPSSQDSRPAAAITAWGVGAARGAGRAGGAGVHRHEAKLVEQRRVAAASGLGVVKSFGP